MQLQGGDSKDAILDLTGCPGESINFSQFSDQDCWELIKISDDEGYIVSAYLKDDKNIINYPIINLRQINNGIRLINLRNVWGNFQWKGDWSQKSQLWNDDLKKELGINQHDEKDFWISYEDLIMNFQGINIYKTRNWEEIRIKGKFITVLDLDDNNIEVLLSKWYYSFEVQQDVKINIGVHQEDEKIIGVKEKRPYLDIGISVFQRTSNNDLEIVEITPLFNQRQIQCELTLQPGSYIILPRTSICSIKSPTKSDKINLLDEKQTLTPYTISTIQDIFRKFDILLVNELTYIEFKGFFECIQRKITQKEFEINILKKYQSTNKGITLYGFIDFFRDQIINFGEENIFQWLQLLGYDRSLNSLISRICMLTIHSDQELQVSVKDALQTDLDYRATTIFIWNNRIEHHVAQQGIRVFYTFDEYSQTYSYLVLNDQKLPILIKFDCSETKDSKFSTKSGILKKRVEPNRLEFLMHIRKGDSSKSLIPIIDLKWEIINE